MLRLKCLRVSQPYHQRLIKFFYFIGCTPNSNFSANHEENESDQDYENHSGNINEGNYPANKYTFKVNNR